MKRIGRVLGWSLAHLVGLTALGCGDDGGTGSTGAGATGGSVASGGSSVGGAGAATSAGGAGGAASGGEGGSGGSGGIVDPGPMVDYTRPQLFENEFSADDADPLADERLDTQLGYLDTRVQNAGHLVVYLHGAGDPSTCGSRDHGRLLAGHGYHVLSPCYATGYGVGNCGDDIEGCRLEAFEGVDHHELIAIDRPNSAEERIVQGLAYLQSVNPEGDWTYYLDGSDPKWSRIIVSGISHGASSSGVVGLHREVARVVMLSGPLDSGQPWLDKTPLTPIDRFYGFTHTADDQHAGHLAAFEALGLLGSPTSVDTASSPYAQSHRLMSSADSPNGHTAVQAGGSSPTRGEDYVYEPVWSYLYGAR